jgi:hypothetical protein
MNGGWAFNNASKRSTVGHNTAGNVMPIDEFHRIILQRNIRYWHDLICVNELWSLTKSFVS